MAVTESGASFTYGSTSSVTASTDHIHNWVHLYSASTDPDGDSGYASRRNGGSWSTTYAATLSDEDIAVDLGATTSTSAIAFSRVFKAKTVAPFPVSGVTRVTATVSIGADPATGLQPIAGFGLMNWGTTSASNTSTQSITNWGTNTKKQLNLNMRFKSGSGTGGFTLGTTYHPTVTILMKYSGFTTTYYQYTVTLAYKYGS